MYCTCNSLLLTSRGSPALVTWDENYLTKTKRPSTSFSPKIGVSCRLVTFTKYSRTFYWLTFGMEKSNTADGKNASYHLISFIFELTCIE